MISYIKYLHFRDLKYYHTQATNDEFELFGVESFRQHFQRHDFINTLYKSFVLIFGASCKTPF